VEHRWFGISSMEKRTRQLENHSKLWNKSNRWPCLFCESTLSNEAQ